MRGICMYYFQELPAKQVWIEQEFEKKKIPRIIYETTDILFFLSTTIVKKKAFTTGITQKI